MISEENSFLKTRIQVRIFSKEKSDWLFRAYGCRNLEGMLGGLTGFLLNILQYFIILWQF